MASLVFLGVLLVLTGLHPAGMGKGHTQVQSHLLEGADQWVVRFKIINREGRDLSYTIDMLAEGRPSSESAVINDGATFTYIYYISRDRLTTGQVSFAIYREGEDKPIEEVTYYLKCYQHGAPVRATLEATQ